LGQRHRTGFSSKISYHYRSTSEIIRNIYLSIVSVGPLTFRHGNGYNNFVIRGRPLGWKYGSDGYEYKIGLNQIYDSKIISKFEMGYMSVGGKSIINNSYLNHFSFSRDSNSNNIPNIKSFFIKGNLEWWLKPEISILTSIEWVNYYTSSNELNFNLGANIFLPKNFIF